MSQETHWFRMSTETVFSAYPRGAISARDTCSLVVILGGGEAKSSRKADRTYEFRFRAASFNVSLRPENDVFNLCVAGVHSVVVILAS